MYTLTELASLYENKYNKNVFNTNSSGLYLPVNHIMSIPGKRIRPMLVLLSCDAFGGQVDSALSQAYALELFHNFTLVHDDIMDKSDIRRGFPTAHQVYGINAGILAGDLMLAYTYKYMAETNSSVLPRLLELFNDTAIKIFEGQQMDIEFEKRDDVKPEEYLKMIEYKTSVLLACCLQTGAMLAGASDNDQKLMYNYGICMGLSFQIKDDLLDAFGEAAKVGKRIGGDILMNKKTYLYIATKEKCSAAERKELMHLANETNEEKKIERVKELMRNSGGYQVTLDKAEALYNQALDYLRQVSISEANKSELYAMTEMINNREY